LFLVLAPEEQNVYSFQLKSLLSLL